MTLTLRLSYLDFYSALEEVAQGKAVTRQEWDEEDCRCKLIQEQLCIFRNGEWHPWTVTLGDMVGEDWMVLD